jgi:hypothetical protein
MKSLSILAACFIFSSCLASAADKKPKDMKPKLVTADTILVKDVQFLLKPNACQSIAIGFRQKTAFDCAVYGGLNRFSVVDHTQLCAWADPTSRTLKG